MGMLFNSKATTRMLQIVNDAFGPDSWGKWFEPDDDGVVPADLFKQSNAGNWPLHKIAKKMKIFAGDGEDGPKDKRFRKWLKGLDAAGVSTRLREQILKGLTDENVSEIYFVLVPSNTIAVAANPPIVGSTMVITISTVDVDHVPTFVEKRRARVAARRGANRKKKG